MDSGLIGLLPGKEISLQTLIVLVVMIVSVGYSVVKFISWARDRYKGIISKVKKDTVNEYEGHLDEVELKESVSSVEEDISVIFEKVDKLTESVNRYTEESNQRFDKLSEQLKKQRDKSDSRDEKLHNEIEKIGKETTKIDSSVHELMDSEAGRIKSHITALYHKYVPLGEIDALTLAALKDEYNKYVNVFMKNTFIHGCFEELSKLKIVSSTPTTSAEILHYIELYGGPVGGGNVMDDTSNI